CFSCHFLIVEQAFLCRQGYGQIVNHHQDILRLVPGIIQKKGFRQQEPRSTGDQYFLAARYTCSCTSRLVVWLTRITPGGVFCWRRAARFVVSSTAWPL